MQAGELSEELGSREAVSRTATSGEQKHPLCEYILEALSERSLVGERKREEGEGKGRGKQRGGCADETCRRESQLSPVAFSAVALLFMTAREGQELPDRIDSSNEKFQVCDSALSRGAKLA